MTFIRNVLVIKGPGLSDFALALGAMQGIRQHHPHAHITLLTHPSLGDFGKLTRYFDTVLVDEVPKWWQVSCRWALYKKLKTAHIQRVYDLDAPTYSNGYYPYLKGTEWSGAVRGCSHPLKNPLFQELHPLERYQEQLKDMGISHVPRPSIHWALGDFARFNLPETYVVLSPGGSQAGKNDRFVEIAQNLLKKKLTPVLIGTLQDTSGVETIHAQVPAALNLVGKTSLNDLALLALHATGSIGNDTGVMHLMALGDKPCVVICSAHSAPNRRQRGSNVTLVNQRDSDPTVREIMQHFSTALDRQKNMC